MASPQFVNAAYLGITFSKTKCVYGLPLKYKRRTYLLSYVLVEFWYGFIQDLCHAVQCNRDTNICLSTLLKKSIYDASLLVFTGIVIIPNIIAWFTLSYSLRTCVCGLTISQPPESKCKENRVLSQSVLGLLFLSYAHSALWSDIWKQE